MKNNKFETYEKIEAVKLAAAAGVAVSAGGLPIIAGGAAVLAAGVGTVIAIDRTSTFIKNSTRELMAKRVEKLKERAAEKNRDIGDKESERLINKRDLKKRVDEEIALDAEVMALIKKNKFKFSKFTGDENTLFAGLFNKENDEVDAVFDLTIKNKDGIDLIHIGKRDSKTIMISADAINNVEAFEVAAKLCANNGIKEPVITPPPFDDVKNDSEIKKLQALFFVNTHKALVAAGYSIENISLNKKFANIIEPEIEKPSLLAMIEEDKKDMEERKAQYEEDVEVGNVIPDLKVVNSNGELIRPVLDPEDNIKVDKPYHKNANKKLRIP